LFILPPQSRRIFEVGLLRHRVVGAAHRKGLLAVLQLAVLAQQCSPRVQLTRGTKHKFSKKTTRIQKAKASINQENLKSLDGLSTTKCW
uniref:Secreted protein n=1 Tax=Ascaris lumbricoides TaxID=6252 RepID=A0A0M3IAN1_ASCLU